MGVVDSKFINNLEVRIIVTIIIITTIIKLAIVITKTPMMIVKLLWS